MKEEKVEVRDFFCNFAVRNRSDAYNEDGGNALAKVPAEDSYFIHFQILSSVKISKKTVGNIITLTLIACGIVWVCAKFIDLGSGTYTDNASVQQNMVAVSSKAQGFIKDIRFDEFTHVNKGDTLVIIEDDEYRIALAQAEANLKNALAAKTVTGSSAQTAANNVVVSDAAIAEVKANLDNAERNYQRYKQLLEMDAVTRQEFEVVETQYKALKARYETMLHQSKSSRLVSKEQTERLDQTDANIQAAQAALDLARLNLSYTVITANCSGYTSKKDIQEGELIQPGKLLVNIVSDEEYWVVANYREKQLRNIEIGTPVEITVDAIKDKKYHGVVTSISNATGSQYSLVPQDNATGNFVKVEQRIPVRIAFTDDNSPEDMSLLRSGLNVECNVKK